MTGESMSKMWERYWLANIRLIMEFRTNGKAAAICQMNMVCHLAQEWAGARKLKK